MMNRESSFKVKVILYAILFAGFISCKPTLDKFTLNSPDGKIDLKISVVDSTLNYQLNWSGQEMIGMSGLEIFPESKVIVLKSQIVEHDSTWNTVWGQHSSIHDNYKELVLNIECDNVKGTFLARVYNEGVAFRFVLADGAKPKEAVLSCSYALPDGSAFFAPNGEKEPLGPLSLSALSDHQLTEAKNGVKRNIHIPLVVETPDHSFMAILESDLYAANGFQTMKLGVKLEQGIVESINKAELSEKELVTPWRLILMAKSAGDLVTSTMAMNLATPCKLENTDWIKPGISLWDFRVQGYTASDGFIYGKDTESYLRFIDFAAEKGIAYFMIDGGWYVSHSDGEFKVKQNLDLAKVMNYAKEKDIDVILYYDREKGDFGDDELFPYYQMLGAKGVKYGFMSNNPKFSREAIRKSAESELFIDFHDSPVPFVGIHRTYPNAVTREYCHAQQDCRKAFTPESFIKMALINGITGPIDIREIGFNI